MKHVRRILLTAYLLSAGAAFAQTKTATKATAGTTRLYIGYKRNRL